MISEEDLTMRHSLLDIMGSYDVGPLLSTTVLRVQIQAATGSAEANVTVSCNFAFRW